MTAVHDTIQPPGPGDSDAAAGASCDAGNKMAAPGRTDLSVHRPPNRGPRECEWKPGGGSRVEEGGRHVGLDGRCLLMEAAAADERRAREGPVR